MNDMSQPAQPIVQLSQPKKEEELPVAKFERERVFPLSYPVERPNPMNPAAMEKITKITLRAPLGMDLFEIGGTATRTTWGAGGMSMEMNADRFRQWIIRLSGLDGSIVAQIPARDLKMMYDWLAGELSQISGN